MGLPPFLTYLSHTYERAKVQIGTNVARARRKVRQGDLLLPLVFILAMEGVILSAEATMNSLHTVYDLILLASHPEELQKKLVGLCEGLGRTGMSFIVKKKKSASITIGKVLLPWKYKTSESKFISMRVSDKQMCGWSSIGKAKKHPSTCWPWKRCLGS